MFIPLAHEGIIEPSVLQEIGPDTEEAASCA